MPKKTFGWNSYQTSSLTSKISKFKISFVLHSIIPNFAPTKFQQSKKLTQKLHLLPGSARISGDGKVIIRDSETRNAAAWISHKGSRSLRDPKDARRDRFAKRLDAFSRDIGRSWDAWQSKSESTNNRESDWRVDAPLSTRNGKTKATIKVSRDDTTMQIGRSDR